MSNRSPKATSSASFGFSSFSIASRRSRSMMPQISSVISISSRLTVSSSHSLALICFRTHQSVKDSLGFCLQLEY